MVGVLHVGGFCVLFVSCFVFSPILWNVVCTILLTCMHVFIHSAQTGLHENCMDELSVVILLEVPK